MQANPDEMMNSLIEAWNAILSKAEDAAPDCLLEVVEEGLPPVARAVFERQKLSLGKLRAEDLAEAALELGGMGGHRLLRCADTGDVYLFGVTGSEHLFRVVHDATGALYHRWGQRLGLIVQWLYKLQMAVKQMADSRMRGIETALKDRATTRAEQKELERELRAWTYAAEALEGNTHELMKAFVHIGGPTLGGVPNRILIRVTAFDLGMNSDPHLVGCKNGVLDLRRGQLREGRAEDRITMSLEYDVEVRPPSKRFLQEVVNRILPVPEERKAVQKWMAYCLYGEAPFKGLLIATDLAGGNNGKSFLFNLLVKVLGEYAMIGDKRLILAGSKSANASSHDEAGAMLKDKRFCFMDEGNRCPNMMHHARANKPILA